ncbi:MAG: reverse transcriptase-like protein [Bacillus sp. (in: firmicutes)]
MKVLLRWTYRQVKKPSCTFQSDFMSAQAALLIAEDLERTGRATNIEFLDDMENQWTKKEMNKLLMEIEDEPQDVELFFDGGYLKEEKLAGIGIAIYYTKNNKRLRKRVNKLLEELESNNEAEYAALYEGICLLEEMGVHHQLCKLSGDSQVVLNQLSGEWPCFDEELNRWLDRIEHKMAQLGIKPEINLITRKENREADTLASQALQRTIILSEITVGESGDNE